MKKAKKHLFILLLVLAAGMGVAGCQRPTPTATLTAALDSLTARLDANPDSVADVLTARKAQFNRAEEGTRMRSELLRTAALFKAYRTPTDAAPMRAVVSYYERKGNAHEQAWANYYLGGIYTDRGDAPEAIACYLKILDLETELYNDLDLMFFTYARLTGISNGQYKPDNAIRFAHKTLGYAKRINTRQRIAESYGMLGKGHRMKNQNDSAFVYYRKAWQMLKEDTIHYSSSNTLETYILLCIEVDSLDLAGRLITQLPKYPCTSPDFGHVVQGEYYRAIRQLDKAEAHYRMATQGKSLYSRAYGWQGLYECARLRGDVQGQADYAGRYIAAHDSADDTLDEETVSQAYAQFSYDTYKKQRDALAAELASAKKFTVWFWAALCASLALGGATAWLAVGRWRASRRLTAATDRLEESQRQAGTLARKADQARQEAEHARREAAEANERAEALEASLNQVIEKEEEKKLMRQKASLLSFFHQAVTGGSSPTVDDWTQLVHTLDAEWDNHATRLITSNFNLSITEFRICLLQYYQFSYKEMQALTSHSNPSTAKKRLIRKLTSPSEPLEETEKVLVEDWLQVLNRATEE